MLGIIVLIIIAFFVLSIVGTAGGGNGGETGKVFFPVFTNDGSGAERNFKNKLVQAGISEEHIFSNLYLERLYGGFSQIDLAALTEIGVIVAEIKDYSGWIFGNGHQQQWTQILNYGKEKHRFYNPVMQNGGHIKELKKSIPQGWDLPFFSLIIFYGDCTLKKLDNIPKGVYITKNWDADGVLWQILNNNTKIKYLYPQKTLDILKRCQENGNNPSIRKEHIKNIRRYNASNRD